MDDDDQNGHVEKQDRTEKALEILSSSVVLIMLGALIAVILACIFVKCSWWKQVHLENMQIGK